MLRSAIAKPADKAIRLELETRPKALEDAARHRQKGPERQLVDFRVLRIFFLDFGFWLRLWVLRFGVDFFLPSSMCCEE